MQRLIPTATATATTIISPRTLSILERARSAIINDTFPKSFLVFSGPSGAGKSTLLNRLFRDFPTTFGFSVSHTTRNPRNGEINGVDYNFVSEDNFKSLISSEAFLEYANFSGNWYGTTWQAIQKIKDGNKICILDVDLAGIKSIKAHMKSTSVNEEELPRARFLFVRPPCKKHLEARLRGRGSETEESLNRRLARVDRDFEYAAESGNYDLILINDELDSAYAELISFIFKIEIE